MPRWEQSSCLGNLDICAQEIVSWMTENKWMCNPWGAEAVHFSSCCYIVNLIYSLAGSEIISVNERDLGVTLDQCLSMSAHVSNLCKSAFFALKHIRNIRQYLDQPAIGSWFILLCPLNWTNAIVSCMDCPIKKSRNFNVFSLSRSFGNNNQENKSHHANSSKSSLAAYT